MGSLLDKLKAKKAQLDKSMNALDDKVGQGNSNGTPQPQGSRNSNSNGNGGNSNRNSNYKGNSNSNGNSGGNSNRNNNSNGNGGNSKSNHNGRPNRKPHHKANKGTNGNNKELEELKQQLEEQKRLMEEMQRQLAQKQTQHSQSEPKPKLKKSTQQTQPEPDRTDKQDRYERRTAEAKLNATGMSKYDLLEGFAKHLKGQSIQAWAKGMESRTEGDCTLDMLTLYHAYGYMAQTDMGSLFWVEDKLKSFYVKQGYTRPRVFLELSKDIQGFMAQHDNMVRCEIEGKVVECDKVTQLLAHMWENDILPNANISVLYGNLDKKECDQRLNLLLNTNPAVRESYLTLSTKLGKIANFIGLGMLTKLFIDVDEDTITAMPLELQKSYEQKMNEQQGKDSKGFKLGIFNKDKNKEPDHWGKELDIIEKEYEEDKGLKAFFAKHNPFRKKRTKEEAEEKADKTVSIEKKAKAIKGTVNEDGSQNIVAKKPFFLRLGDKFKKKDEIEHVEGEVLTELRNLNEIREFISEALVKELESDYGNGASGVKSISIVGDTLSINGKTYPLEMSEFDLERLPRGYREAIKTNNYAGLFNYRYLKRLKGLTSLVIDSNEFYYITVRGDYKLLGVKSRKGMSPKFLFDKIPTLWKVRIGSEEFNKMNLEETIKGSSLHKTAKKNEVATTVYNFCMNATGGYKDSYDKAKEKVTNHNLIGGVGSFALSALSGLSHLALFLGGTAYDAIEEKSNDL